MGKTRPAVLIAAIASMLMAQVHLADRRVVEVAADTYALHGTDLQARGPWQIGYLRGHHGAFLVKAPRDAVDAAPRPPRDPEIHEFMDRELAAVPRKAALESGFYMAVLVWVVLCAPLIHRHVAATTDSLALRSLAVGGLTLPTYGFLVLPLLAFGYGGSAFTNWVGPGALSWSSCGAGTLTHLPGLTVSYRLLLEVVLSIPAWIFRPVEWFTPRLEILELLLLGLDVVPERLAFFLKQSGICFAAGFGSAALAQLANRRRGARYGGTPS